MFVPPKFGYPLSLLIIVLMLDGKCSVHPLTDALNILLNALLIIVEVDFKAGNDIEVRAVQPVKQYPKLDDMFTKEGNSTVVKAVQLEKVLLNGADVLLSTSRKALKFILVNAVHPLKALFKAPSATSVIFLASTEVISVHPENALFI